MKATNISQLNSSRAPDEWREIPEIKAQCPFWQSSIGQEYSLQQYDGTNLCQWHTRSHVYWNTVGDIFMVEDPKEPMSFEDIWEHVYPMHKSEDELSLKEMGKAIHDETLRHDKIRRGE